MERLTERNPLWIDDEMWERACEPDCEEIDAVYRKLKDYEDAEVKLKEMEEKDDFDSENFEVIGNIFEGEFNGKNPKKD